MIRFRGTLLFNKSLLILASAGVFILYSSCGVKGLSSAAKTQSQQDSTLQCNQFSNTFSTSIECTGSSNFECNYVNISNGSNQIFCYQRTGRIISNPGTNQCNNSTGWVVGTWSTCNAELSNGLWSGTQTRSVTCMNSLCCTGDNKPATSQSCEPMLYGGLHKITDCTETQFSGIVANGYGNTPTPTSARGQVARVIIGDKLEYICRIPVSLSESIKYDSNVYVPEINPRNYACPSGWSHPPANARYTSTLPRKVRDSTSFYGSSVERITDYHLAFTRQEREYVDYCRWRNALGCQARERAYSYLSTVGCL